MDNTITKTNNQHQDCKIKECVNRLENFNTLFDIETLFDITNDLLCNCFEEVSKEYYHDAKNSINKIQTMMWVIREKLPKSLFEDIENLTFYLNQKFNKKTPN